jgi:hypothetical protein
MWNVASSDKISRFTKPSFSIFICISSQNSLLFTLSAAVSAYTNRILYSLGRSRLLNTFHTVIFGMPNSLLALATDLRGLRRNATRTLSMLSSDTRDRPGLLPLHNDPVSTNCRYHLVTSFLCGASFLNRAWNSRCIVITDQDSQPYFTIPDSRLRNLVGQVPVFMSPRNRLAQLYPQALGYLFIDDSQGCVGGFRISRYSLCKNTQRIQLVCCCVTYSSIACSSHVTYLRKCVSELLPRNCHLCWLHNSGSEQTYDNKSSYIHIVIAVLLKIKN